MFKLTLPWIDSFLYFLLYISASSFLLLVNKLCELFTPIGVQDFPFSGILCNDLSFSLDNKFWSEPECSIRGTEPSICICPISEEGSVWPLFWFDDRVEGSNLVDSLTPKFCLKIIFYHWSYLNGISDSFVYLSFLILSGLLALLINNFCSSK